MAFEVDIPDARPRASSTAAALSFQAEAVTREPQRIAFTARDIELLTWITRYGMVIADQICRRFFGTLPVTWRRLRLLEAAGMLRRDPVWHGLPRVIRTTRLGTRFADVDLGPAPLDYVSLRHQLAVLDLSEDLLSTNAGAVWVTERELRRDRTRAARGEPGASTGRIPDGVVVLVDGRRIAVELDLTPKRTRLLESLAGAFALNRDMTELWWYAPSETAASRIGDVARSRGLEHLITVRVRRVARR